MTPALTQIKAPGWKACSPRAAGSSATALRQPPVKRFVEQPEPEENQAAGDDRWGDVGADARVAAGAGQLRRSDGHGDSQGRDGKR